MNLLFESFYQNINFCLLIILTILIVPNINAQSNNVYTGIASVVDGDNLRIDGVNIRLFGIDAPEIDQTCKTNNVQWNCGKEATKYLKTIVGEAIVSCEEKDFDKYKRPVATCSIGSINLSREMVVSGLAVAYTPYSDDYVIEQAHARFEKRGMWSGEFINPEDWRKQGQQKNQDLKTTSLNNSYSLRSKMTDQEIKELIIQESIMSYRGSCPCPYSINRAGRRCGGNSAYSKPGGAQPFCFHHDISESMVERYKDRQR